jgi:homocysteine S-methyltransferase
MSSLLDKPLLFLDGGLGTTLEDEQSVELTAEKPLWSSHLLLTAPETLTQVHRDFAEAGADIILTATYQASLEGFENTTIEGKPVDRDEARRAMQASVQLAREAFGTRRGLVALSLGAYGATMSPSTEYSGEYGNMTENDLIGFHQTRLEVFSTSEIWANLDMLAFETLPRLDEINAVRQVARDVSYEKPYWISCVFSRPDDNCLPDGSTVQDVVEAMLSGNRKPEAVGINCTKLNKIPSLVREFEDAIEGSGSPFPKLVLYPDGAHNLVYDTSTLKWVEQSYSTTSTQTWDERLADMIREAQGRGKWKGIIVGGCCKASPAMIKRLRSRLEDLT